MPTFRTTGYTAKPRNPLYTVGKHFTKVHAHKALVSADLTNGDIIELAGAMSFKDRVHAVFTPNASPALTAATDAKLGFFKKDLDGALSVIQTGSDALLWNGVTLAAALSTRDMLLSLNTALDTTKNIGELLGLGVDKEPVGGVFLGLTFPTKPSVDGVLNVEIDIEKATTD